MWFFCKKRKEETSRIFVRDMVVETDIGVYAEEHGRKQRVSFTITAEICIPKSVNDDLQETVSYDMIVQHVLKNTQGAHINLLETLAENVARDCLGEKRVKKIAVRAEKLDIYPFAVPGVEIIRAKSR